MSNLSMQQLLLGSGLLTTTGNSLYINGSAITTSSNSTDALNLSGSLFITGQALYNDIIGLSGIIPSINNVVYTTGTQNIGGNKIFSGNYTFFNPYPSGIGYTGVSGLVYTTGSGSVFYANDTGNTVSIDFYKRILSGNWNSNNLNISGNIVATAANLASTGQQSWNSTSSLSGKLIASGSTLYGYITALSGQIAINTGTLTGTFYSVNNPSGFITSGMLTGNLYPLTQNFNQTINWASANTFYNTLTGNTTFNFIGQRDGQSINIIVSNTGIVNYSSTWPSVKWPNQTAPIQSSGATDIYTFLDITGLIFGTAVQNF